MTVLLMSVLVLAAILLVAAKIVLSMPVFGGIPSGNRLERMENSPNYRDGRFHNIDAEMSAVVTKSGMLKTVWKFLFGDKSSLRPAGPLHMVKADLKSLPADKDIYVWFGHSSYLLSLHGTTVLVDPVFCSAAPFRFVNKPFEGTEKYLPEDMPDAIDFLVITHDHYDHLDYQTVVRLKDRIGHVVCPLGTGAHFERWGFAPGEVTELDWGESYAAGDGFEIDCLPARHFSGRSLRRNNTLWASYMMLTPYGNIFIGGDGGYGSHFSKIGKSYGDISLAILENGQYNVQWKNIHTMPEYLGKVAVELGARKVLTVHHSKYALARHPWDEPLENEKRLMDSCDADILVAELGKPLVLELQGGSSTK